MAARKRRGRARGKFKTPARRNQVTPAQNGYSQNAQNGNGLAADATRNGLVKLDEWSRNTIRTQPYASALVVLGAGWFLGSGFLRGKSQRSTGLLGGKTHGIGRLFGHNTEPRASILLRLLATALVDIGSPER